MGVDGLTATCRQQGGEAGCREQAQRPYQSSRRSSGQRPRTSTGTWPNQTKSGTRHVLPAKSRAPVPCRNPTSCPFLCSTFGHLLMLQGMTPHGPACSLTVLAASLYIPLNLIWKCVPRADPGRDTKTGDAPRHWRWRGFLTDYYTAELPEGAALCSSRCCHQLRNITFSSLGLPDQKRHRG